VERGFRFVSCGGFPALNIETAAASKRELIQRALDDNLFNLPQKYKKEENL